MRLADQLKAAGRRPEPEQALPILRKVYLLAFLVLVVPVALLGLIFLGERWGSLYVWTWFALSIVLSCGVLALAGRPFQEEISFKSALTVAIRLGSAPAVPALFAALNYSHGLALTVFLLTSAGFYLIGHLMLRSYSGPYRV
ncbi:hypothetical protein [Deinococcus roseus]|uniref:Uncharacterized protein n=1 Tax=Deinococcus roseus TaxID=392414 RepID=A0ABQ2CW74_9DEIO|nr:hypothetical protein [Deinococcus roseus]GGJ26614.1 hypothetical protein GCM10008938_10950 [Deinococcus roseus]